VVPGLDHAGDALNLLFPGGDTGRVAPAVGAADRQGPGGRR